MCIRDSNYRALNLNDLYDATLNLVQEGDDTALERERLAASQGWYIRMEGAGEKILGSSATFDHVIRFTSYLPGLRLEGACRPDIGESYFWAVNLLDGTPVNYTDSDDLSDKESVRARRRSPIPGGGLAPPVQTIFVLSLIHI